MHPELHCAASAPGAAGRGAFIDEGKEYILFCGAGWRSALATKALQDMGMTNVAHIDGGFGEWVRQGAPVENDEAHRARRHPAKA